MSLIIEINFHLNGYTHFCQAQPQLQLSWAEMVFNVNLTPPTHPAGKVSGKQDKAIYAKRKLSVFRN